MRTCHPSVILILLLLLTGIGPILAQPAVPRRKLSEEEINCRRDYLLLFLKTDSGIRAADELALLGAADKGTWMALIRAMAPQGRGEPLAPQYIDALAAAGAPAIPDILRAMEGIRFPASEEPFFSGAGRSFLGFVAALGRMGPAARPAIPALRKLLADPKLDGQFKAAIRVTLANIGDDSKANLDAILRDLKDGPNALPVVRMLASERPGPWVEPEMMAALIRHLEPLAQSERTPGARYEGLDLVAVVLGLMGGKAAGAANTLDKVGQHASGDNHVLDAVVFGVALARIDHKREERVLRDACKVVNDGIESPGHIRFLVLRMHSLVDARISKQLVRLLDERDTKVAAGAATLLYFSGQAAQGAFNPLLAFVRGKAEEPTRAVAARALATVTPFSELPRLEEALKAEKSEKVRRALWLAIQDVKFLGPGSSRSAPSSPGAAAGWE